MVTGIEVAELFVPGEITGVATVAAIPIVAEQIIARKATVWDTKETARVERFIRKPFLRREHATMPPLRLATNERRQRRPLATPLGTSGYS